MAMGVKVMAISFSFLNPGLPANRQPVFAKISHSVYSFLTLEYPVAGERKIGLNAWFSAAEWVYLRDKRG